MQETKGIRGWIAVTLGIAVFYALAAGIGIGAEIQSGYPARFWPAAGVGLVAVVLRGRAATPGMALGCITVAILEYGRIPEPSALVAGGLFVVKELAQPWIAVLLLRGKLGSGPRPGADPHPLPGESSPARRGLSARSPVPASRPHYQASRPSRAAD